jgi:hypothetical protein
MNFSNGFHVKSASKSGKSEEKLKKQEEGNNILKFEICVKRN